MLLLAPSLTLAATLVVPDDYATLDAAVDAFSSSDVIEITKAGKHNYSVSGTLDAEITFRTSFADPTTVVVVPGTATGFRTVTFQNLTLGYSYRGDVVTMQNVVLSGAGDGNSFVSGALFYLTDVTVDDVSNVKTVFDTYYMNASDVIVRNTTATKLISAGADTEIRNVDVRCSHFGSGTVIDAGAWWDYFLPVTTVDGLLIASSTFGIGLRAPSDGRFANVSIIGSGSGVGIATYSPATSGTLTLSDSYVGSVAVGVQNDGGTISSMSRLWMDDVDTLGKSVSDSGFLADVTAATSVGDVMLSGGGDLCEEGWWPMFGSPLVDAGDPAGFDHDGSRTDIGATGGEFGLDVVPDVDEDGYSASRDCDDANPGIRPGVSGDSVGDDIDEDCDGADGVDLDGDGASNAASGGDDCDDRDATRSPLAVDTFGDGHDDNCDGADGVDADGDGAATVASGGDDCDDDDARRFPAATDAFGDGLDADCDGFDGVDRDGDGHATLASGGDDCDDDAAQTFPGHPDQIGDGIDRNCDGSDGVDADGDEEPSVESGGEDCVDTDPTVYPGAADSVGDGTDQDCDGADGVDADADGHASGASGGDDCADDNPAINPDATEDKGGDDLDCDGKVSPGCGCSSANGTSGASLATLLGVVALLRRRR